MDLTVAKLEQRGIRGVATLFKAVDRETKDPRGFEAFYPGPGHTSDNIVIAFPKAEVLFGGCLVKSTAAIDLGFTADADVAAWLAAVRLVADKYHPRKIVPGHGQVGEGDSALRHTLDLLLLRHEQEAPGAGRDFGGQAPRANARCVNGHAE